MNLFPTLVIAAVALLAGCATAPPTDAAREKVDLSNYRAVNVAPVRLAPGAVKELTADERATLERDLRTALTDGLPPPSRTDELADGVVRIEVTVTELNTSSAAVNALTTALLFVPFDSGGVAFEARFFDGASSEPFAQTSYRHTSTPLELKGSFSRYGQATKALRNWASELTAGAISSEQQRRRCLPGAC